MVFKLLYIHILRCELGARHCLQWARFTFTRKDRKILILAPDTTKVKAPAVVVGNKLKLGV